MRSSTAIKASIGALPAARAHAGERGVDPHGACFDAGDRVGDAQRRCEGWSCAAEVSAGAGSAGIIGLRIAVRLLPIGQDRLLARQFLVWNLRQEVRDRIETRALLVVRPHDTPRRPGSNTTQNLRPLCTAHSCGLTSYSLLGEAAFDMGQFQFVAARYA